MKIQNLGEFAFIDSIKSETITDSSTLRVGIGDDCAVYIPTEGMDQIVSTDVMVEDVHFSTNTTKPFDIGYRLTAANLSDLAAMGSTARQVLLAVAVPKEYDVIKLQTIYDGVKALCKEWQVNIIGGDTVSTKGPLVLTMTAIGELPANTAILRSGAQEGDYIGVTGVIGSSSVGLDVLLSQEEGYSFSKNAHQRPMPQLAVGNLLRAMGVHAMNDISDGLANELYEIAKASNRCLYIEAEKIPLHEETRKWGEKKGINPIEFALFGGEDFQLVFTFSEELLEEVKQHPNMTVIGRVGEAGDTVFLMTDQSTEILSKDGYDHFS